MKQFTRRRGSQKAGGSASLNGSGDVDQLLKAPQQASCFSFDAYSFPDDEEPAVAAAPQATAATHQAAAAAVPAGDSQRPAPHLTQPQAAAGAAGLTAADSLQSAASGGGAGSGRALAEATRALTTALHGRAPAHWHERRQQQLEQQEVAAEDQPVVEASAPGKAAPTQLTGSQLAQQQQEQQLPRAHLLISSKPARHSSREAEPLLPLGLVAAAGLLAAAEGRPAQTVMEAQERGELVQLQDDARYAMDGLAAACSRDTQRDSAVTLTDMLCSRRGRMALRADGLAQQVLSSLAKLKSAKDAVLGVAATIALLMLTSEDAHPAYLASVAAAVLMEQLLQSNHSFEEASGCGPSGAKLAKLLRARPLCTLLATTGVTSQRGLLLIALEQATSSQQASKVAAVEKLKHNLRQYGGLQRLGKLAAAAAQDAGTQARELHMLLLVLENATFTCQANGSTLVQLQVAVPAAAGKEEQRQQQEGMQMFPAVLVSAAQQLLAHRADLECRQALHVCLSVLMNLSHQNAEGSAVISEAGGLAAAAATIVQLLGPAGQDSHQALCKQVLKHLELLSVALGVLINLVSGEPGNSRRLAGLDPAAAAASAVEHADSDHMDTGPHDDSQQQQQQEGISCEGLVPLLCTVMTAVGGLLQQQEEQEATQQQQQQGAAAGGGSITLAPAAGGCNLLGSPRASESASGSASGPMDGSSAAGEASIIEVYCGMLLGFLGCLQH
ncbi:wings apart-like protein regulation of heterochromatin-domain-containing protein [Scenedesmus sp. NREL 46B-D3]|nr:wings apart-like protein regulation of heterochromatin-domain-containing protein [Scenedesmus sp. NREL 46B-D3]